MVAKLITLGTSVIEGIIQWLTSAFGGISDILYTEGDFTTVGTMLLIGVIGGVAFLALKTVFGLARSMAR